MLQKVLKFADYAMVMLIWKICFFAPIMPKIMLAQSAKANLEVPLPFLKMNPQNTIKILKMTPQQNDPPPPPPPPPLNPAPSQVVNQPFRELST